jgi:hypothetical protein
MNILTTRGYIDCITNQNYRFLSSFKETIHCQIEHNKVAVIDMLSGIRAVVPASVMIETSEGIMSVTELKFGVKIVMNKSPRELDEIKKLCISIGKKKQINEEAWYMEFLLETYEEMISFYLSTGCCVKIKKSNKGYVVSVPSDILNMIDIGDDSMNIDRERDPFEIVKDIRIINDLCLKADQSIDRWSKLIINGCICYNIL